MESTEAPAYRELHISQVLSKGWEDFKRSFRVEVPLNDYFAKLAPADRRNLTIILESLRENDPSRKDPKTVLPGGELWFVGSSVKKSSGWHDLDLRVWADRYRPIDLTNDTVVEQIRKTGKFSLRPSTEHAPRGEDRKTFYLERTDSDGKDALPVHLILATRDDAPIEVERLDSTLTRSKFVRAGPIFVPADKLVSYAMIPPGEDQNGNTTVAMNNARSG